MEEVAEVEAEEEEIGGVWAEEAREVEAFPGVAAEGLVVAVSMAMLVMVVLVEVVVVMWDQEGDIHEEGDTHEVGEDMEVLGETDSNLISNYFLLLIVCCLFI